LLGATKRHIAGIHHVTREIFISLAFASMRVLCSITSQVKRRNNLFISSEAQ